MGNRCIAQSGEEYYKSINYEKYRNNTDMNKKYQYKNKIYSRTQGIKTIKVFDMTFSKTRIMKQVAFPPLISPTIEYIFFMNHSTPNLQKH